MLIVRALRPFDEIGHVIGRGENSVKSVRKTDTLGRPVLLNLLRYGMVK